MELGAGLVGVAIVLLGADPASAYRPFVSTDAAVAALSVKHTTSP